MSASRASNELRSLLTVKNQTNRATQQSDHLVMGFDITPNKRI